MAHFKKPGWTQFPNEIFDQLMPVLSGAQFKVLCLIARQTAGWHKDRERLSLVQIMDRTGLSRQGTVDSIQALEEKDYIVKGGGVMRSRTDKPEACWYELSVEDSGGEYEENGTVNSVDRSGNNQQSTQLTVEETGTVNSVDRSTVNSVDSPIRSKEIKEIDIKESSDLQLDEDVSVFIKNAYRRSRGAKVTSANIKQANHRILELEVSYGPEEFRQSLWAYLSESSEWLRQNKWPLAAFLKKMESCGAYQIPREEPRREVQQELPGTEPPQCPILDMSQIAARYHELAPHAPKFFLSSGSKPEFPALHDPEFFPRMDEVFMKVESLWSTGRTKNITWLNLPWVMKSKNGVLNWNTLMMGTIDGMCRDEAGGGKNSTLSPGEAEDLKTRTIAMLARKRKEREKSAV